ncbi:hypothetical protein BGX26_000620 [Mortierella sp. AD094]|nr:hypothetical protein BGX26_000620 [Mortierella sp. AD094]
MLLLFEDVVLPSRDESADATPSSCEEDIVGDEAEEEDAVAITEALAEAAAASLEHLVHMLQKA